MKKKKKKKMKIHFIKCVNIFCSCTECISNKTVSIKVLFRCVSVTIAAVETQ